MDVLELTGVVFGSVLLFLWLFCPFFILYCGYVVYLNRNESHFRKRGVILLYGEFLCMFISTLIIPILIFVNSYEPNHWDSSVPLLKKLSLVIFYCFTLGIADIAVARICYYDMQISRTNAVASHLVQSGASDLQRNFVDTPSSQLPPPPKVPAASMSKHETTESLHIRANSMVFDHESRVKHVISCGLATLGSPVRLTWLTGLVGFIQSSVLSLTATEVFSDDDRTQRTVRVLFLLVTLIVVCIILIMFAKCSKRKMFEFEDQWFITKEYRALGKMLTLTTLLTISLLAAEMLSADKYGPLVRTCYYAVYELCFVVCIYVSSIWVHRNNVTHNGSSEENDLTDISLFSFFEGSQAPVAAETSPDSRPRSPSTRPGSRPSSARAGRARSASKTAQSDGVEPSEKEVPIISNLSQFWDIRFDAESNYLNVKHEFVEFCHQTSRELNVENVLFWVNSIQLLQFLINSKYIDRKDRSSIEPLRAQFHTEHHIKDTYLTEMLKKAYHRSVEYQENSNYHYNDLNYTIFGEYYMELYKVFLQRDSAPFELNIAFKAAERFAGYYEDLKHNPRDPKVMNKQMFDVMWHDIRNSAIHVYNLLSSTFRRYKKARDEDRTASASRVRAMSDEIQIMSDE